MRKTKYIETRPISMYSQKMMLNRVYIDCLPTQRQRNFQEKKVILFFSYTQQLHLYEGGLLPKNKRKKTNEKLKKTRVKWV